MADGRAKKCRICGVDYIEARGLEFVHEYAPSEPRCEPCTVLVHVAAFDLVQTKLTPKETPRSGFWQRFKERMVREWHEDD